MTRENYMNISVSADTLFSLWGLPITNTLLMTWAGMAVLALAALILGWKIRMVPDGKQNAVEAVFDAALDLLDDITGNRNVSYVLFPLVVTILLFVLASNWVEILPGLGSIGIDKTVNGVTAFIPFMRSPSSDLNFTIALAFVSILSIQAFSIKNLGLIKHLRKYISFKSALGFFVGILEIISEVSKIISFSFRLFGNIFAGEVLLAVSAFLMPLALPIPFLFLELFVGAIQAVVFAGLTAVFMGIAVEETEEEERTPDNRVRQEAAEPLSSKIKAYRSLPQAPVAEIHTSAHQ